MADENKAEGSGLAKVIGVAAALIIGAIVLAGIGGDGEADIPSEMIADESFDEGDKTDNDSISSASAWDYQEEVDELRNSAIYYASVVSENEVYFDFPYNGGSSLTMTIRKSPAHGRDVIFQISDGQFVCGTYDCQGMISFDGQAEPLTLATPADHDSKVLFARYGDAIINKLKAADKAIVELQFYQEGNRQFTFNTKGLEWEH